ncbi:MAG: class I SAM-dependent methyltransferase [Desulfobacteraceae bacterium]|nr:MAG: class I SAM-dependent methyltransferase [Desulfobacteraceae bacterium]
MKLKTAASLMKSGKWLLLLRLKSLFTNFYRVCFLAAIADSNMLEKLSRGPFSIQDLTADSSKTPSIQYATEAWIKLGVRLGVFKEDDTGYSLQGFLAKMLAAPENDAIRALVREVAGLHHLYITQTPEKLKQGLLWNPDEQHAEYGDVIARSSQTLEPFLFEVIDRFFPASDDIRLLEVGCGYAGYILYAAGRHGNLNAVGLELDLHVAETANANIQNRGLQDRIKIEMTDVRKYRSAELFDVLTLYNNIYYFPVEDRIQLFRHLRSLLRPNGRILLTTGCMDGGIEFELVNLIHATTKGWGRLPYKDEMLRQLYEAGFERNSAVNLIPGERYYAFVGHRPL